jgi:hypothetical protein
MSEENSPQGDERLIESIINLAIGALDRGQTRNKDFAVRATVEAASILSLNTNGEGNEMEAIKKARDEALKCFDDYEQAVKNGEIKGMSRGGFHR